MKKSLKDIAYERIRSRILQCDYLPGAMLSETALCQEMEISRTPVREALNKLEQENLVTIYPKKGILVKDLSVKDLHAIYETRFLLEPYVVRTYGGDMDPGVLTAMNADFRTSDLEDDALQFRLDDAFHDYLVAQSRNPYLIRAFAVIAVQNTRIRFLSGRSQKHRKRETQEEHDRIIRGILAGNHEEAAEELLQHLRKSKEAAFATLSGSAIHF